MIIKSKQTVLTLTSRLALIIRCLKKRNLKTRRSSCAERMTSIVSVFREQVALLLAAYYVTMNIFRKKKFFLNHL